MARAVEGACRGAGAGPTGSRWFPAGGPWIEEEER
jgi:hypothetical protein